MTELQVKKGGDNGISLVILMPNSDEKTLTISQQHQQLSDKKSKDHCLNKKYLRNLNKQPTKLIKSSKNNNKDIKILENDNEKHIKLTSVIVDRPTTKPTKWKRIDKPTGKTPRSCDDNNKEISNIYVNRSESIIDGLPSPDEHLIVIPDTNRPSDYIFHYRLKSNESVDDNNNETYNGIELKSRSSSSSSSWSRSSEYFSRKAINTRAVYEEGKWP